MTPNLIKDMATLIIFFLLALLPIEVEAYMNRGHFLDPIKNTSIFFICWVLALLIFILGKTANWYFNLKTTHLAHLIIYPPPEWWIIENP
jgi:hypothetical protein